MCELYLCEHLTAENVAVTLVLADQHSAETLRAQALRFICTDAAAAVFKTDGWNHILRARPSLVSDVFFTKERGVPPPMVQRVSASGIGGSSDGFTARADGGLLALQASPSLS